MLIEQQKAGVGGAGNTALPYHVRRFKTKMAMGQYPMETALCYCGSSDGVCVTEHDRYGIDYRMNMCRNCGIMYANPRMSPEACKKFYEEDYRNIYGIDDGGPEEIFRDGIKKGNDLKALVEHFDRHPKSVFDIGCNMGGMLQPFMEAGCDVLGVDFGESHINFGKSQGIPIELGTIDDLLASGKKADLVIMHHVLEHLTDPADALEKVSRLLNKDGMLFIGLPGLFAWSKDTLFQNAHVWQFSANTLTYMMNTCGYEEIVCNEWITSLWSHVGTKRSMDNIDKQSVYDVYQYMMEKKPRVKQIKTINKFPTAQRKENIKKALSYGYPSMSSDNVLGSHYDQKAIIIGGGPSADLYVDKIKELQADNGVVIAIERMYAWCNKHGIVPDYVVALDASDDVVEGFADIREGVTHLVSTQCPTSIFELMKGQNVLIFNSVQGGIDMESMWDEAGYERTVKINAGGSVTLGSFSIAMTLGCRDVHIFGFDCHITNGGYANGIVGVGEQNGAYQIEIEGRVFLTTSPYISFAQQFFELKKIGEKINMLDSVKVYGDTLVGAWSVEPIGVV